MAYLFQDKTRVNPNARGLLEKSQRDLARQCTQLAKISHTFHDEALKSQTLLNATFARLHAALAARQAELQARLDTVAQQAQEVLVRRQMRAAELRELADHAVHLDDQEAFELKADIKVRQLGYHLRSV